MNCAGSADDAVRLCRRHFHRRRDQPRSHEDALSLAADRVHMTSIRAGTCLRPEMRSIHQREVDAIRNRFGRFLLVNTNFGWTNSDKGPGRVHGPGAVPPGKA